MKNLPHSHTDFLKTLGAPHSWNPRGLSRSVQEQHKKKIIINVLNDFILCLFLSTFIEYEYILLIRYKYVLHTNVMRKSFLKLLATLMF